MCTVNYEDKIPIPSCVKNKYFFVIRLVYVWFLNRYLINLKVLSRTTSTLKIVSTWFPNSFSFPESLVLFAHFTVWPNVFNDFPISKNDNLILFFDNTSVIKKTLNDTFSNLRKFQKTYTKHHKPDQMLRKDKQTHYSSSSWQV